MLVSRSSFNLISRCAAEETTECHDSHYVIQPQAEKYVFSEVNRLRVEVGLEPLKKNLKLQVAARDHSCEMARLGYFSHDDFQGRNLQQRLAPLRLMWQTIAENIAKCQDSSPARTAVDGWFHSPGHKRNMLNPDFTETGIGAVVNQEGEVSFCQIFMRPNGKASELPK
ncbi:MAG TPA: CAP domain-containing protein [Terriglobia bacterium]|nr:CAP domain-containing protein [Terriglobia bacterium]